MALADQPPVVEIGRGKDALHRAVIANVANEGPGVDSLQADDAPLGQIIVQFAGGAEVACPAAPLPDNESGQMRLVAFDILGD